MGDITITEKIDRYKVLAIDFLNNNIRVAIWDINDDYYFAHVVAVRDDALIIQAFSPRSKANQKHQLRWAAIVKLEEYKDKEVVASDE